MGDFDSFRYGNAAFPLSTTTSNTLLRDADPALFYLLDFLAFSIEEQIGDRVIAEVEAAAEVPIAAAVSYSLPFDPSRYLKQVQFKFPLLAAYRKSSTFSEASNTLDRETALIDVLYVLPPMTADGMERISPFLNAVKAVIKNAVDVGIHSAYTAPGETSAIAVSVWSEDYAGLEKIECKTATFGAFEATEDLFFPTLMMTIELRELVSSDEEELETFVGVNAHIDVPIPNDTTVLDVVQFKTNPEPTVVSISPSTGTKQGGTAVTLTCTNLITTAPTSVFFDGEEATNVVVVSATSITCVTPAHDAHTTAVADVYVVNDGVTATLDDGFTFTSP